MPSAASPEEHLRRKQLEADAAAAEATGNGVRRASNKQKTSVWRDWAQQFAQAFELPSRKPTPENEMEDAVEGAMLLETPFVPSTTGTFAALLCSGRH